MRKNTPEDFWNRLEAEGDCRVWPLAKTHNGYGLVGYQGAQLRAHRLAWVLTHGEIPDGMMVLHKCDNPPCCNPDHLFLGTQMDNMRDRHEKGRDPVRLNWTPSDTTKERMQGSALTRWSKMTPEDRKAIGIAMGHSRTGKVRGPYKGRQSYAKGYKPVA